MVETKKIGTSASRTALVARNAASSVAVKGATMVGALGLSALLSRHVGVQGFGLYAYALSIANLLGILVLFGLDQIAIRELSQANVAPAKMLGEALALQIGFATVCLLAIALVSYAIGVPRLTTLVVMVCSVHVFLEGMSATLNSVFRARQRMEYEAVMAWVWCILLVGLAAVGVYMNLSLSRLLLLISLSYTVRLGAIIYFVSGHFEAAGMTKWFRPRRNLLIAALPFAGMSGLQMVYNTYPRLIVGNILAMHDVGVYAAAERVVQLLLGMFIVADMVVFPIFAKDIHQSRQRFATTYCLVADGFMAVGMLTGLCFSAFAKEIIAVLYGPGFEQSASVLSLLIPAVSMGIPGFVNARALIVMHLERFLLAWTGAMVCLGIGGTLLAVPRWGLTGMVLAWSFPIALGFVFFFCFIRSKLEVPWLAWRYLIYFLSFVLAFGISYAIREEALWMRLLIHLCIVVILTAWYMISGFLRVRKFSDLAHLLRRNPRVELA